MKETTKSNIRRAKDPSFWNNVLRGSVIDIGCGDDQLKVGTFAIESVKTFDRQDGDANAITRYIRQQYDTVYSSQCLEHVWNPHGCMLMWWSLVKPGGHMVITVPDFDLYEQGVFPSRWNTDHKWTFTLNIENIQCIRMDYLALSLPNAEVLQCGVIDTNYNRNLKDVDQTLGDVES